MAESRPCALSARRGLRSGCGQHLVRAGSWWRGLGYAAVSRRGILLRYVSASQASQCCRSSLRGVLRSIVSAGEGFAAIVLGGAAPVFFANWGLTFAPAAHAGALFPGVMPLLVALLAAAVLGEEFSSAKKLGFALIVPGVLAITLASGGELGSAQNLGHMLFLCAGLAWAFYTVALRGARLGGLHAAAISAVGSALLYLPIYLLLPGTAIGRAPWFDIALQAFVQGILTAIISLMLYGKAVSILGASSGAAFAALCPAMTALMAIPVLGEWPQKADWAAIVLISAGVYIVSGGPLPRRLQRTT